MSGAEIEEPFGHDPNDLALRVWDSTSGILKTLLRSFAFGQPSPWLEILLPMERSLNRYITTRYARANLRGNGSSLNALTEEQSRHSIIPELATVICSVSPFRSPTRLRVAT